MGLMSGSFIKSSCYNRLKNCPHPLTFSESLPCLQQPRYKLFKNLTQYRKHIGEY